ncbi:Fic family protein [Fusobacterium necrophorum]|uniref:Fic family protein n=1 Tax=Fusobacterium necrophorum TaxID=859 RepID=UPI000789A3FA|nr:Fic family protein [Fusobacterium necrophorum]KYM45723.1 cell filamentation protein Fic [Fusobacterium necrophorum subsp. funduliforme]KYM57051.1 cell filamentation protein Fic [Fusobacterium necrophorum subsp. funduliforme]MCF0163391.1 Fic family protein [Fusobacterium necrophorum]MDK4486314.1 Fic family protein [Fusobacterium necrophorum]MDK4496675.1 Fic family protein [Fusobacterium necrophorum]
MIKLETFKSGNRVKQDLYYSFIPNHINDFWKWDNSDINILLETANLELGGLNSFSDLIPDIDIYIRMHIKTEANKSSRIEGTKTSIEEEMMNIEDIDPEKRNDYEEVHNYIKALDYGIDQILNGKLPFSSRLIKEIHKILLNGVRGKNKYPGEYRISQNWIGGSKPSDAKHVPPPHYMLNDLMSDLEKFIHNDDLKIPHLIKIAILHYQFETIHPFSDGNGRVGRLMIPLYLLDKKILNKPCFYISDYFEKNRTEYYDALTRVRENNDMTGWIKFFLKAVIVTAQMAKKKFQKVVIQVKEYESIAPTLKGKWENILKILNIFYSEPILKSNEIVSKTGLSKTTVNSILKNMEEKEILSELTNYKRNKMYILRRYFMIFIEGIDLDEI